MAGIGPNCAGQGSETKLPRRQESCKASVRHAWACWSFQSAAIRRVTAKRDQAFLDLLVLLTSWSDVCLHMAFNTGAGPEGVEIRNSKIRAELKPGPYDDLLLEQSTKDAVAGFATVPLRWSQLVRHTKGAPIRLIPRCVITQSSGKKRVIDDAAKGGQSALCSDANKLVLC